MKLYDIIKAFRQFCRHDFRLTNAQPVVYPEGILMTAPLCTVVLYRCSKCEAHMTNMLMGTWTVEDLMRTETDISQLEAMYSK